MRDFSYVCADPGIPLPGTKGASIHVASVCHAFVRAGLKGRVFTPRAEEARLGDVPLLPLDLSPARGEESTAEREARLFLAGLDGDIGTSQTDFIYERYSLWHTGGLARARQIGVPFILEVNSPLPDEARRFRKLANPELAEGIARLLLREADGIVCVSRAVAEWVVARRGRDEGVWVIPNGVDAELFDPADRRRPEPLPPDPAPLVAFSGSFRPWHGLDDLAEGFRRLVEGPVPDARLVCVGEGPLRGDFEARLSDMGLTGRVHMTGGLPHEQVADWLRGADVAVAPYPQLEDFYFSPLKVFEFLALGLPVVAGNAGELPLLLPDGVRGLLYTPGRPDELTDAMARMLLRRNEARALADAGRAWVLENATWSKRVESILHRIQAT